MGTKLKTTKSGPLPWKDLHHRTRLLFIDYHKWGAIPLPVKDLKYGSSDYYSSVTADGVSESNAMPGEG